MRRRRATFVHRLLDPLMRSCRQPRRRPGLEDQPAGADRRPRPRRPGVRRHRRGPGPREGLHRPLGRRRRGPRRRRRAQQEGGRAAGRRDRLDRAEPARRGALPPPRPRAPRPPTPRCLSCPRSRSSGAGCSSTSSAAPRRGRSSSAPASVRRHLPGPADLAARVDRPPCWPPRAGASTSGSSWTAPDAQRRP